MSSEPSKIKTDAMDAYAKAMLRRMNPTWGDLVWNFLASSLKIVVLYTVIGAALRFGWKLIG